MIWRLAAFLICLTGAIQAQSVYKVYIPHAGPVSRVAVTTTGAGWDVTVSYDSERCAIACTYRRMRLARLLAMPPAVIRVYAGPAGAPQTVIVDPAGVRFPHAAARPPISVEQPGLPSRTMLETAAPRQGDRGSASIHDPSTVPNRIAPALPTASPLRI